MGGFAASLALHDVCQAHAIPVWCGGMLESGIGRACTRIDDLTVRRVVLRAAGTSA